MQSELIILSSLLLINGWSVVDRRILDVIDRLDGTSAVIATDEIIAAVSDRRPRFPGDTIDVSSELHDSAPAVIGRIDTVADGFVYHLVDAPISYFCVGRDPSCFVEIAGRNANDLEDALLDRLLSTHERCLALASTYVLIDRLLLEPLMNSQVIVQLRDGRYAHMYEREGKVRFDSVIAEGLGVQPTGIELFTVYKTDAVWPKDVHILNEKVKRTTKTDRSKNLHIQTLVYRSNDSTFVRQSFSRRTDWDSHGIILQAISEQRALIVKGRVVAGSYHCYDQERAAQFPKSEAEMLKLAD